MAYLELLSAVFSIRIPDLVVLDSLDCDLWGEAVLDSVVLLAGMTEGVTVELSAVEPPEVEGGWL